MGRNYNPRFGSSDSVDSGRRAARKSADDCGSAGASLRNGRGDGANLRNGRVASQRKLNDSRYLPTAAGRSASGSGQRKPDDDRYPLVAAGRSASANRNSTAARRRQQRSQSQYGRQKIEYLQVAQTDMAQSQQYDPRLRYSSFRHDRSQKVLDDQGQSRFADIHRSDAQAGYASGGLGTGGIRAGVAAIPGAASGGAGRPSRRSGRPRGMTVQEYRRQQRQQQAAARRANVNSAGRRLLNRVILVLLGLALLLAGGFILYHSPAFTISQISVEGNQYLSNEQVIALAAVPENSTLLRVNPSIVAENIAADIWITEVKVRRGFPSTLNIVVTERQVAAVVEISSTSLNTPNQEWLLSSDGIWLAQYQRPAASEQTAAAGTPDDGSDQQAGGQQGEGQTAQTDAQGGQAEEQAAAADGAGQSDGDSTQFGPAAREPKQPGFEQTTRLTEVSRTVRPVVGESVSDGGLSNALAIINGLSAELRLQIQHISAPDRVRTTLTLTNNVSIAFGAAEDIAAKEQVIKALLAEHQGKITYINVRVPDRATYRAAG